MFSDCQFFTLMFCLASIYVLSANASYLEDCNATEGAIELTHTPLKVTAKRSSWSQSLDLFYFSGYRRRPSRLFLDAHLQINLTDNDVKIYQGDNCSIVLKKYNDDRLLFGLLRRFSLLRSKQMNPFGHTVIGIVTDEAYTVRVRVLEVSYLRAGAFFGAIILYFLSYSLVRNALFFYSSGCALGVIASLLIVGFTAYRFTPKKWLLGFPLLFGGWSISFYGVYFLWRNFTTIVLQYQKFVAAYFATVIIISFAVCYRYGPPTDVRSHNLAQWALQLIALLIVYFSCQIDEISIAVIAVLVAWSFTKNWVFFSGSRIFSVLLFLWHLFFPKTRRLLTLEEYEKQGAEETKKAMEQLRSYCRSPKADAWKITSAISNPKRFASFIEGSSDHISEEEVRLYEYEGFNLGQLSDDSGEDELLLDNRNHRLDVSEHGFNSFNVTRDRSYVSECPSYSHWERRHNFQNLDHDDDNDFEEIHQNGWGMTTRSLPTRKTRSTPTKRSKRSDNEYNGLLMPVPSHMPRSDPDQLCSFYQLTMQQSAIYKFLKYRGMHRGNDYAGESEQSIKQGLPEECFDEEEFDNDLERLVEVNLIHESFLDGYWRTT